MSKSKLKGINRVAGEVDLPGVGVVKLRSLTIGQIKRFEESYKEDKVKATLQLVALSLCDDAGVRCYNDDQIEELENDLMVDHVELITKAILENIEKAANIDSAKKN